MTERKRRTAPLARAGAAVVEMACSQGEHGENCPKDGPNGDSPQACCMQASPCVVHGCGPIGCRCPGGLTTKPGETALGPVKTWADVDEAKAGPGARSDPSAELARSVMWMIVQDFMMDRISPDHRQLAEMCPQWFTRSEPAFAGDTPHYSDRRANIVRDVDALYAHLLSIAKGDAPRDRASYDFELWFAGQLPSAWSKSERKPDAGGMDRYPHAKKTLLQLAADLGHVLPVIDDGRCGRKRKPSKLLAAPDSPTPMWDVPVAARDEAPRPFDRRTLELSPAHADFVEEFSQYCPDGAVVQLTTRSIWVCDAFGRGDWVYYLNGGEDAAAVGERYGRDLSAAQARWNG